MLALLGRPHCLLFFFFLMIRRPPRSTPFPTRRSSELHAPDWLTALRRAAAAPDVVHGDRKSTRLNSSHQIISYAVFCLKKKKKQPQLDGSTQGAVVDPPDPGPAAAGLPCVHTRRIGLCFFFFE